MKVKDLLKALEKVNPEMPVFCTSATDEYEYCIINSARVRKLTIYDENDPENDDDDVTDVFLIDEQ